MRIPLQLNKIPAFKSGSKAIPGIGNNTNVRVSTIILQINGAITEDKEFNLLCVNPTISGVTATDASTISANFIIPKLRVDSV